MKTRTIVIVNDGLGPNKGDQAILLSMVESMRKAIPEAELRTFPNSGMTSLRQYYRFIKTLRDADLFLFGGGQEIQDHASVAFLISGLLKVVLARSLSKPVLCYALGVGPVGTALGRLASRAVLNGVDFITVRDGVSRKHLIDLGITTPPCVVTADPALALAPAKGEEVRGVFVSERIDMTKGPRIAIAPRRWFHYKHHILPMSLRARIGRVRDEERFAQLKQVIAEVADRLVERHNAQVIFVPMRSSDNRMDPGQDDNIVSREIIGLMRFKRNAILLKGDHPPPVLKGFFGEMDLVIGMRMHSLILASMMDVPVLGISLSPKFRPFFDLIGQGEYLIPVEEVRVQNLLEKISMALAYAGTIKTELTSRKTTAQELALSNVRYVQHLLESSGK
jgi:polysaccharide pyruvyl transferase WcaK-like protein